MKNVSSKKIRKEYKAMIAFSVVTLITIIVLLVFSLLPLYSVVGDENIAGGSSIIDRSSTLNSILIPVLYLSLLLAITFLIMGISKDVREKLKKKS